MLQLNLLPINDQPAQDLIGKMFARRQFLAHINLTSWIQYYVPFSISSNLTHCLYALGQLVCMCWLANTTYIPTSWPITVVHWLNAKDTINYVAYIKWTPMDNWTLCILGPHAYYCTKRPGKKCQSFLLWIKLRIFMNKWIYVNPHHCF